MRIALAAGLVLSLLAPSGAAAQDGERPWLEGFPVVEQSLDLPAPRQPDLAPACKVPEGFDARFTASAEGGPYGDARYVEWIRLFHGCKWDNLVASLESDLKGGSPHPQAAQLWALAMDRQGRLEDGWQASVDPALLAALGPVPDMMRLYYRGRIAEADRTMRAAGRDALMTGFDSMKLAGWLNGSALDDPAFAFRIERLERYPDQFLSWWPSAWSTRDELAAFDRLTGPGGPLAGHFFAAAARRYVIDGHSGYANQAMVARLWLDHYPNDPWALYMLHSAEDSLGQVEQAAASGSLFNMIAPQDGRTGAAKAYYKLGRMEEGDRQVAIVGGLVNEPSYVIQRYAIARDDAGYRHEAMAATEASLARLPGDTRLIARMATLEERAGMTAKALERTRMLVREDQFEWSNSQSLMDLLRKEGLANEALASFDGLAARVGTADAGMIIAAADAAKAAGLADREEALLLSGLGKPISQTQLLRRLIQFHAAQGQHGKVVQRSRQLLALERGYRSDYQALMTAAEALQGAKGVQEALQWSATNFPQDRESYYAAMEKLGAMGEKDQAAIVIAEARRRFPDSFFPLYFLNRDVNQRDRAAVDAMLAEIRTILPSLDPADAEWAVRSMAFVSMDAVNAGTMARDQLAELDPLIEKVLPNIPANTALTSLWQVYEAQNRSDSAMALWERNAIAFPHDPQPLRLLRTSMDVPRTRSFLAIWKSLSMDRFNADRLKDMLHVHAQWGGSNVLAHCMADWAETNYPQAVATLRREDVDALLGLGESVQAFEYRYANSTSISPSQRYVGWFQDTKSKALEGGKRVDFDCKRGIATIVDQNGDLEIRQTDYNSGKLRLMGQGGAWVRYDYTDRGDLSRIFASNGRSIALDYDDNFKISRMVDSEQGELTFAYNAIGKPVVIDAGKDGSVNVSYDDAGNITSVVGNAPEGGDSSRTALTITQAFQNLLGLVNPGAARQIVTTPDPEFSAMLDALFELNGDEPVFVARLADAMHAARTGNDAGNSQMEALDDLSRRALDGSLAAAKAADLARYASELHALYDSISPFGLPDQRWNIWENVLRIAESRGTEKPVAAMLANVRANRLEPMNNQNWQGAALLRNAGHWYADRPSAFVPASMRSGLTLGAALVRADGDLVVASNNGLLVRREGNWGRYVFDADNGRFRRADVGDRQGTEISVTSLAELDGERLAVGTSRGIYVLGVDYETVVARAATPADGLATALVRAMLVRNSALYVATSGGLSRLDLNNGNLVPAAGSLLSGDVAFLADGPDGGLLAGNDQGVFQVGSGGSTRIVSIAASDAAYSPSDRRLLILDRARLLTARYDGAAFTAAVPLTNAASANIDSMAQGFESLDIGGERVVALMGDRGYSIWRDGYFEYLQLPYSDSFPGVKAMAQDGDKMVVAASNGSIFRFEPDQVMVRSGRPVVASAYDAARDIAYFADGRQITAALPSERGRLPSLQSMDYALASHLALDRQGRLVANDGDAIVRFDGPAGQSEYLFDARPSCPSDWRCNQGLTGLLVAEDGSIWASSGPSVFRWQDGTLTEYNALRDLESFPADTHWIAALLELPGGDIVVSASNEGHLTYRGNALNGQNLVFRNGAFETFDDSTMFLSRTNIDGVQIVGTSSGYYEAVGGLMVSLASSGDPSYLALRDTHPNLYLGGEGALLGDATWLFPTPAGIAAYQNGEWFYPERLNWHFPRPEKAGIGGRHSYTLQVDKAGRIYAGTDTGLLVFQQRGGDAVEFLVENSRSDLAFSTFERRKLQAEAGALLRGIDQSDPVFAPARRVIAARQELERLRGQGDSARTTLAAGDGGRGSTGSDGQTRSAPGAGLAEQLQQKEREYTRLLAVLEREEPGLAQLLTIKPLELAALQRRIPDGAVVLQYIPHPDKLMLHVIARDSHEIRTVEISRDALMGSAERANQFLKELVGEVEYQLGEEASIFGDADAGELPADTPANDLAALYEMLLAPVESDLEGYERVYISAAGKLNLVPFAALRRMRGGEQQYAVERYSMAMVPTSYLLALVLDDEGRSAESALIFGDPDGSLANARIEASEIQGLLAPKSADVIVRIGSEAGVGVLRDYGASSRVLHFATHGKLDHAQPERSFLVMADRTRLSAIDIMMLDLSDAELAFLSACETGLGSEGLEYATLARSFSHAGVPTTIASLWQVGDAATLQLVTNFYKVYDEDSMAALAEAQRAMIKSAREPLRHPAAWSAFEAFGKGW
ncbi:MAG: CHAT domain-containing protein [Blastomonas sp.]